jgi:hypothetical protein
LELTKKETIQVEEIKQSSETLYVCTGCCVTSGITLKELFGEDYIYLELETEQWLAEIVK